MRRSLVLLLGLVAACGEEDGGATPDTAIETAPPALTNSSTATFFFRSDGAFSEFQCSLDGGASVRCSPPHEITGLADGEHVFAVAAALNQNRDETPAMHTWRIDTVPPTTAILSAPAALDNDVAPTITFEGSDAEGPVTFECALDGGTAAPCTSPHVLSVLDGNHAFSVTAIDAAGNRDETAATHDWVVNTAQPDTTITSGPAAASTTGPNVVFEFTSPDTAATFECALDGASFAACTSPRSLTNLGNGNHTFAVRATGVNGPDPTPVQVSWIVDAAGPVVTIQTTPTDPSNDATPAFTFTADETATFECRIDGVSAFAACTSPFESPALADGARTFRIRGTDGFGNVGADATFTWTVDLIAPTVTIDTQPAALSNNASPSITFTPGGNPTLVECRLDAGAFAACTSPFTTTVTDGAHTISVRVTDAATNSSTATTSSFTVDTVAPTVTIDTQPAALSNDNTPTITFTTAGNPTVTQCRLDAGTFTACTSPFTTTATDGDHTITVRVIDGATNTSSATTATFTVDTVAPTVAIDTQPAALSNDTTPTMTFTVGGNPSSIQCRVDSGALTNCSSGSFTPTITTGTHTMTVVVSDAATNSSSATTSSFTIDSAPPVVTFTDAPPAKWPVNYYDIAFQANETSTFECSLNGAAFVPCTSPFTVTTTYGAPSNVRVRATDQVGNLGAVAQTAWTSTVGQVLHYAWERGDTANSSLLAQRAAFSPDGEVSVPTVGGWAGAAIGSNVPDHKYPRTRRPLTSAAQEGNYTVSFWIRPNNDLANGQLLSTIGADGGFRVRISGNQLTVGVFDPALDQEITSSVAIPFDRWVHVGLRSTGPAKGMTVFIDGQSRVNVPAPIGTGFDAGQDDVLVVGPATAVDLDDLRFFNHALSNAEMCTVLTRGRFSDNSCTPIGPKLELDFEQSRVFDTGTAKLSLSPPQLASFPPGGPLGNQLVLGEAANWGYTSGFRAVAANPAGRTFALWFFAGDAFGSLLDIRGQCFVGGPPLDCGYALAYSGGRLQVVGATDLGAKLDVSIPVDVGKRVNVVVTEQRDAALETTLSLTVFVNGVPTVIPVGAGDIYQDVSDGVRLVSVRDLIVDEYEFWAADLSTDPEALCENGFDGLWDPVDDKCALTAL